MLLLTLLPIYGFTQDIDVHGGFLSDSLKIGEQTAYYLSARYPSDLTILFPDSTHAFTPFEYVNKEYFLTHTTDGISADSTVYYLTTFEIDRIQFLQLPVYVVQQGDCTVVTSERDSVLITQFVTQIPDSLTADRLPLKMNTAYQKVFYNFNVWLLIIVVGALVVIALLVWLLFGKRISRYFLLKRMEKNHAHFLNTYNGMLARLAAAFSPPATESALVTWKRYMEQLEARPYTKLTTRETLRLLKEPALTEDLGRIDRAIYGHDSSVVDSLEHLKGYADQKFRQRLKEVQHG
jgi:hypothetical protein